MNLNIVKWENIFLEIFKLSRNTILYRGGSPRDLMELQPCAFQAQGAYYDLLLIFLAWSTN